MYKLDDEKPEVFEFEYEGKTYSVPSVNSLPLSRFMKIRKALNASDNAEETMFDEIMGLFSEYIPDVMERLTMGQAAKLFSAYSNPEGASLGE